MEVINNVSPSYAKNYREFVKEKVRREGINRKLFKPYSTDRNIEVFFAISTKFWIWISKNYNWYNLSNYDLLITFIANEMIRMSFKDELILKMIKDVKNYYVKNRNNDYHYWIEYCVALIADNKEVNLYIIEWEVCIIPHELFTLNKYTFTVTAPVTVINLNSMIFIDEQEDWKVTYDRKPIYINDVERDILFDLYHWYYPRDRVTIEFDKKTRKVLDIIIDWSTSNEKEYRKIRAEKLPRVQFTETIVDWKITHAKMSERKRLENTNKEDSI